MSRQNKIKDTKKTLKMKGIVETKEYQDMLDRVKFDEVINYLKNNQGKTLENIIEFLQEDECEDGMKFLMNVWVKNWYTFLQSGGRIIKNNDKYYGLSPKNSRIRDRNPNIDLFL
jgi:hypothetical protein